MKLDYSAPIALMSDVTLTLKPQSIAILLDLLGNLPFKQAEPIFREIWPQLTKEEDKGNDGSSTVG